MVARSLFLMMIILCVGSNACGQESAISEGVETAGEADRKELVSLFTAHQELAKTWLNYGLSSRIDISQIRKGELLSSHQFRLRQIVDRSHERVFVVREMRATKANDAQDS